MAIIPPYPPVVLFYHPLYHYFTHPCHASDYDVIYKGIQDYSHQRLVSDRHCASEYDALLLLALPYPAARTQHTEGTSSNDASGAFAIYNHIPLLLPMACPPLQFFHISYVLCNNSFLVRLDLSKLGPYTAAVVSLALSS